jgi:hypothetical protein
MGKALKFVQIIRMQHDGILRACRRLTSLSKASRTPIIGTRLIGKRARIRYFHPFPQWLWSIATNPADITTPLARGRGAASVPDRPLGERLKKKVARPKRKGLESD